MTTRLILARHGNTFGSMDEPVWVGARSDLPLVEKGLAQAEALGDAIVSARTKLNAIIAGPLQRTKITAEIVAEKLGMNAPQIAIDHRLTEIDYGAWEGLSTAAIIATFGEAEMAAWNEDSIFPTTPGWKPDKDQIQEDAASVMAEIREGLSLIITSNGILRFFARQADNAHDFPNLKVAPGNACMMERDDKKAWHIVKWNVTPSDLINS